MVNSSKGSKETYEIGSIGPWSYVGSITDNDVYRYKSNTTLIPLASSPKDIWVITAHVNVKEKKKSNLIHWTSKFLFGLIPW